MTPEEEADAEANASWAMREIGKLRQQRKDLLEVTKDAVAHISDRDFLGRPAWVRRILDVIARTEANP